ncbi:L,D-transpeptidase family protein [Piscinibacter sp. HJYY11]|uniref:L,D-transpeptidase family protein n=1 Tax=Piscinibacter sp. HJYY11 TaxID=2801333 RepID=UPI00191DEB61|nr:L,D-transpeptidase family protein [Piscinibacter sp. HJYY11]MBL0726322.1 L,D-transpeptidase family protein [Piscinibacter sp. HJYY11]
MSPVELARLTRIARKATLAATVLASCALAAAVSAAAAPPPAKSSATAPRQASPEARLIEVYRLIRAGDTRQALAKAESLARDVPNFQLAQLVYGDLLLTRRGKLGPLEVAPSELPASAAANWVQLRHEAAVRLAALTERPPAQAVPRQFIDLPTSTRHAIAVDASRSRLYLFENDAQGLRLVADHYVSLGRLGVDKKEQGDQRTPLGVYFITSRLEGRQLKDFYGPGALTLNYPNEYDRRRGKTGSGIWLHGVPPENYARSPQSTDGCVVLANDDLMRLLREVSPRRTPVVIAPKIEWVAHSQNERERTAVRALVEQWRQARSRGDMAKLMGFYSPQFTSGNADLAQWSKTMSREVNAAGGRESELKELSILSWRDSSEVLIITFGEVLRGQRSGPMKRQYWGKEGGQWKIFFEGVIG